MAYIRSISPDQGEVGDVFTAEVSGDGLTGTTGASLGAGIGITRLKVVMDGLVTFKVTITQDARPGPRDLELDVSGVPSRLVNAFKVL